ncbi:MAG: NRDE family protein [Myxococcales bacterium]
MCTLAFVLRPAPGIAFAASGNRNEFLARPAREPMVERGFMTALLPRDLRSGGTWLGLNAHGLFVCLTNRRGAMLDPGRVSRGELVVEALRSATAAAVREWIARVPGNRHNGYHLLFTDGSEAGVAVCDGTRLQMRVVRDGELTVVTERTYGAGEGLREAEVWRECHPLFVAGELSAANLRPPMQQHGQMPLEGACVHADDLGYGTRSSIQLVVRDDRTVEMLWTEGHPCTAEAIDYGAQATALLASQVISSS